METEHTYIRRFAKDDTDAFCELIRDKMNGETAAYDEQFPTDDDSLRGILNYFVQTDEFLAVTLKGENRLIGYISLNKIDENTRNLGFCIHSAYQKKNYATEAVGEVISYVKNVLKVKSIVSGTALCNVAAVKLLKKYNFTETSRSEGSFTNDEKGKPITFVGCAYTLTL